MNKTTPRRLQERGRMRREQLINAAHFLLMERNLSGITFKSIAERAEVPESSARHFFKDLHAVFHAVEASCGWRFVEAVEACNPRPDDRWSDMLERQIDACISVYRSDPMLMKLLVALNIHPDLHEIEVEANLGLAARWARYLERHFEIPGFVSLDEKLRNMIECLDALIRIDVMETGAISKACGEECKILAVAYLGSFLPAEVARLPATLSDSASTTRSIA